MKGTPETPQCGFSRASIQILGMQGVDPDKFTAFNVLEDQDLRQGTLLRMHTVIEHRDDWTRGGEHFELLQDNVWGQCMLTNVKTGIKEYSEWPTIPQLYVDKEFVGGCDILMSMHQDGSLAKMLEEKGVVVPAEGQAP